MKNIYRIIWKLEKYLLPLHCQVERTTRLKINKTMENSVKEIKQEIAGLVIGATEKVLQEKLDPAKDKQIIKDAITKTLKA